MVSVLRLAARLLSRFARGEGSADAAGGVAPLHASSEAGGGLATNDHYEARGTKPRHVLSEPESRSLAKVVLALEGATALFGVGRAQASTRLISRDVSEALETAESGAVTPEARDAARRVLWKSYVDSASETAPAAEVGSFAVEKAWAEAHGVPVPADKVTVVAKRRGDEVTTDFKDEIVVFTKDGTVERFQGTTRPSQLVNPDGKLVPDVDGDGKKDLGTPRPGIYRARGPWSWGVLGQAAPAFRLLDHGRDSLPAWRDLDGDGAFSPDEKAKSEARGYRIGAVRIHYGFDTDGNIVDGTIYAGPISVGCQNIQLSDLPRFLKAVGGAAATFDYAIVEDID